MSLEDKLNELGIDPDIKNEWDFTPTEETHVVAHLIRHSSFLTNQQLQYITPDAFSSLVCKYVVASWKNWIETNKGFPPLAVLYETIAKQFTVDDEVGEEILAVINQPPDANMSVRVQDGMYKWLRHKAYSRLFNVETIKAHANGEYDVIDRLIDEARAVLDTDAKPQGLVEHLEAMWSDDQNKEVFPLGIKGLDDSLGGGMQRKQLWIWVAPTNKGKTHFMVHDAVSLAKAGKNVLFITFETAARDCTKRMLSNINDVASDQVNSAAGEAKAKFLKSARLLGERLKVLELEPDKYNCEQLTSVIKDYARSAGFMPDAVVIDYLELILNKRARKEESGYESQKAVSTQLRGLAQSLNVAVITATQTNRGGLGKGRIGLKDLSESFGKAMAADFVASINVLKVSDTGKGIGRIVLAKSRHSAAGGEVKFLIEYAKSRVLPFHGDLPECDEEDSKAEVAMAAYKAKSKAKKAGVE